MRKTIIIASMFLGAVALILACMFALSTGSGPAFDVVSNHEKTSVYASNTPTYGPGVVAGRVLNSMREPVAGALVWADRERTGQSVRTVRTARTVRTDAQGWYAFKDLVKGTYMLDAKAKGLLSPGPKEVRGRHLKLDDLLGRPALTKIDLVLRTPGRVTGQVVASGEPIQDASISLFYLHSDGVGGKLEPFALSEVTRSSTNGSFDTGFIAPGRLRVLVEATGFALKESKSLLLREDQEIKNLIIDLMPSSSLVGNVVDQQGEPVRAEVLISGSSLAQSKRVRAQAQGKFRVDALPLGAFVCVVTAPGFRQERIHVVLSEDKVEKINVVMSPAKGLFGRVVSELDGTPVARAMLAIHQEGRPRPHVIYSKTDGHFSWDAAPTHSMLQVDIGSAQFEPQFARVLATGKSHEIRLKQGGRIVGSVVDSKGQAVPSFVVAVEEFTGKKPWMSQKRSFPKSSFSQSDGTFDYGALRSGSYHLRFASSTYGEVVIGPIEVRSGQVTMKHVVMQMAGGVRGIIRSDKEGQPVAGARVDIAAQGSVLTPKSTRTKADGTYLIEGVAAGRRALRVSAAGFMTYEASGVLVSPGAMITRDITLLASSKQARFAFHGIGATLSKQDKGVVIMKTMEGSPAARFGLQGGDVIVSVDREDVSNARLADVIAKIRGKEGEPVSIEVMREGKGHVTLDVERGRVIVKRPEKKKTSR